MVLFDFAMARLADPGLAGRAKCDPIKPIGEQVGVSHRARPSGQDHEYRLKGVFGVLAIDQELPANPQDHRSVPSNECCERILAGGVALHDKSPDELTVGQSGNRSAAVKRLNLPDHRCRHIRHPWNSQKKARVNLIPSLDTARMSIHLSRFLLKIPEWPIAA
jgi:hypothetical protein